MKPCRHCGAKFHQAWKCPHKDRSERVKVQKLKKGKVGKQWDKTRATWFKRNPQDFYNCYLCGKSMPPSTTTLDHIKSRSRYPELRFTLSNLAPCCWTCNANKGSKDLEQIIGD